MSGIRQILSLAAKAAGYDVAWNEHWQCYQHKNPAPNSRGFIRHPWVPDENDGDAFRLLVRLQLTLCNEQVQSGVAYCTRHEGEKFPEVRGAESGESEILPEDYSASRMAILLAAAEIGKSMTA